MPKKSKRASSSLPPLTPQEIRREVIRCGLVRAERREKQIHKLAKALGREMAKADEMLRQLADDLVVHVQAVADAREADRAAGVGGSMLAHDQAVK